MSLGGRKGKKKLRNDPAVTHGPRCPLHPATWELHTVLDRRRLSCTCAWDESHGRG